MVIHFHLFSSPPPTVGGFRMTIGKFDYYLLYSNGYSRRVLEIGYDVVSVGMLVRFRETIGLFSAAEIGKSAAD